jgi:hypothetical protein
MVIILQVHISDKMHVSKDLLKKLSWHLADEVQRIYKVHYRSYQ